MSNLMTMMKRSAAALVIAGGLTLVAPAIASADTLVWQGPSADGRGHDYININTGLTFYSHSYLGKVYETQSCTPVTEVQ